MLYFFYNKEINLSIIIKLSIVKIYLGLIILTLSIFSCSNSIDINRKISFNFRSMTYNIYKGGGGDGNSSGKNAVLKHISRIRPDIITINEVGNITNIKSYLEGLGFNNFYSGNDISQQLFASKFPIIYSKTLSNWGMIISPLYNEVSINGKLIGFMSIHLNSICPHLCHYKDYKKTPPREPSAQKRSIEMYRVIHFLNQRKTINPNIRGFIIQGDYNAIHNELNIKKYATPLKGAYAELPPGLNYPLENEQFPFKQFEFYNGLITLDTSLAVDGSSYTWWGEPESRNPTPNNFEHRIDYIAYSDKLYLIGGEILNSKADNLMPNLGLTKYGIKLTSSDGYIASDHLPVFADFDIVE